MINYLSILFFLFSYSFLLKLLLHVNILSFRTKYLTFIITDVSSSASFFTQKVIFYQKLAFPQVTFTEYYLNKSILISLGNQ